MSEAILRRDEDPSGISGTGAVAEIFEAEDGAVAIRWRGDRPSWGLWADIRDLEAIHGHGGKSTVVYKDSDRLVRSFNHVMLFLLNERMRPITCGEHPDHPGRLRLTFRNEADFRFYVALLDGSTDTVTHVEVNGEMAHTWIDPDGDLWLQYFTPLADDNEDPLKTFEREDRW